MLDFAVVEEAFYCMEWLLGCRVGKRISVLSTGFFELFETMVPGADGSAVIDWLVAWPLPAPPLDFKRDRFDC